MGPGLFLNIVAGTTKETSSITASGTVQNVITNSERDAFHIQDDALKSAINKYFGRRPNDAYLSSPTPWNDLYKTYGWTQVQTILTVKSAYITDLTSSPTIMSQKRLENTSNHTGIFTTSIQEQVEQNVTTGTSTSQSVGLEQTVEYTIGVVGGSTTFKADFGFAQSESKSTTTTVGSASEISVELGPHEAVEAQLTASKGVLKARIVFQASLSGDTAVNYDPTFNGHHFYALPIDQVMSSGGISNSFEITQDVEVGYFSNGEIILKDLTPNLKISSQSVKPTSLSLPEVLFVKAV